MYTFIEMGTVMLTAMHLNEPRKRLTQMALMLELYQKLYIDKCLQDIYMYVNP